MASAITVRHLKRLEQLARAGLTDQAIAKVLGVDEGVVVNRHQVRYYRLKYSDVRHQRRGATGLGLVESTR